MNFSIFNLDKLSNKNHIFEFERFDDFVLLSVVKNEHQHFKLKQLSMSAILTLKKLKLICLSSNCATKLIIFN